MTCRDVPELGSRPARASRRPVSNPYTRGFGFGFSGFGSGLDNFYPYPYRCPTLIATETHNKKLNRFPNSIPNGHKAFPGLITLAELCASSQERWGPLAFYQELAVVANDPVLKCRVRPNSHGSMPFLQAPARALAEEERRNRASQERNNALHSTPSAPYLSGPTAIYSQHNEWQVLLPPCDRRRIWPQWCDLGSPADRADTACGKLELSSVQWSSWKPFWESGMTLLEASIQKEGKHFEQTALETNETVAV
ncbi:hypothetical protein B0H11DRAFT_1923878 [Mycena galericulata]|nr:hypothetical protein B0H11DRAFT_1923878 [Mycena galericulata]